jgi:hypothetical protein
MKSSTSLRSRGRFVSASTETCASAGSTCRRQTAQYGAVIALGLSIPWAIAVFVNAVLIF